jgi:hypothetical protein
MTCGGTWTFLIQHRQTQQTFRAGVSRSDGQTPVKTDSWKALVRAIMALNRIFVEPMTGIEPAYSPWEANSTPERVSDNAW